MSDMKNLNVDPICVESGTFSDIYKQVCTSLRKSGNLGQFQTQFEMLHSDRDRINLIGKLCDFTNVKVDNMQNKDSHKALELEVRFDELIKNGSTAKAASIISKSLQQNPIEDGHGMAERYSKRGWSFLLTEDFENASKDANRSLKYGSITSWKPHEILGHCYTKTGRYTEAKSSFDKAIENLRCSDESNGDKAEAAKRMFVVMKNIRGLTDKPSRLELVNPKTKIELPTPFGGRNKMLSSASSRVSLKHSSNNGRGLYADQDIKPGSVIIVENPYATVLNDDRWESHCINCLKIVTSPVPCDGCSKVWFCSEDCKNDKNTFHNQECPILPYLYDETVGIMGPLAIRIILTRGLKHLRQDREKLEEMREGGLGMDLEICDKYSSTNYFAVFNQTTNTEKRQFGYLFKRGVCAIFLTRCLQSVSFFGEDPSDDDVEFVGGLILRHLQSCACNAYEICEINSSDISSPTRTIGGAVYSTISLTNHSCAPNCFRYNVGTAGVLRASKFIKKGEEIYDNYGHFYFSEEIYERKEALKTHYMFDCACIACVNEWSTYGNEEKDICFHCPQANCHGVITDYFGVRGCYKCCDKKFYKKFLARIKEKIKSSNDIRIMLIAGNKMEALSLIIEHQMFLDRYSAMSSKHCIQVHEMLRHCYLLCGNTYTNTPLI